LIRKAAPHQKWLSNQPPKMGPIGKLTALATSQADMALGRSSSVNRIGRTAIDSGMRKAPPIPSRARAAISHSAVGAKAQAADARPNNTRAIMSIRLRP